MRFDHVPRDVRIGCRVFHQGEDPAGHETGRANRSAAARHFRHRDKAATGFDLDPAAVPGRDDVIGADLPARINDDLHTVAPHKFTVLRAQHITGAMPRGGYVAAIAAAGSMRWVRRSCLRCPPQLAIEHCQVPETRAVRRCPRPRMPGTWDPSWRANASGS